MAKGKKQAAKEKPNHLVTINYSEFDIDELHELSDFLTGIDDASYEEDIEKIEALASLKEDAESDNDDNEEATEDDDD